MKRNERAADRDREAEGSVGEATAKNVVFSANEPAGNLYHATAPIHSLSLVLGQKFFWHALN